MTKQGRTSYSLQPILLLLPHSCKQVIVLAGSPYSTNCNHLTAQYFQTIQLQQTYIEVHTLEIQLERQRFKRYIFHKTLQL